MASSTSPSPKGLTIGGDGRKPQWKLGKLIGTGACASVYALLDSNGKDTSFVVKVAPLPKKTTRKKTSEIERNARLLHFEGLMYEAHFSEYQGFVLPKLPPYIGPPPYGDKDGFRFLIMEKMKGSFWDVIPPLLKSSADDTIAIGPIADRLVTCVDVFHQEKYLVVDIKPENFMLAYNDHNRKSGKNAAKKSNTSLGVAEDLAAKVRMLDLGLITRFRDPEGHRPNDGISEIVGTPLYASLNSHAGQTPSRRDDIQALLFVIAELIIRIVAAANGETADYEGKGEDVPTFLPWSDGKSDEAIGKVKEKEVNNVNSLFYKRMGSKETAQTMKKLFDMTSAMKYKAEPDYDTIRELLSSLVVSVQTQKKKAAVKPKSRTSSARSTRATKRTASKICDSDDEEEESPTKFPKTEDDDGEDEDEFVDAAMEVESDDDGEDEDEFVDAQETVEMDWEPLKENRSKSGSNVGLSIVIEEGPQQGQEFSLTKGDVETVFIGNNPKASKAKLSEALWPLSGAGVDDTHARLDLKATRQVCSVKVTFLKSKTDQQAFISDSFTIGQSKFRVQQLSEATSQPKAAKKAKLKATTGKKKVPLAEKKKPAAASSNANDATEAADVNLVVVSGPRKGDSFSLSKSTEIYNFGSARSVAKKGSPVVLDGDGIEKTHARVSLQKSKKLTRVCVTDLSKTAGTFVNGKKIAKNKETAAFIHDTISIGDTTIEIRD